MSVKYYLKRNASRPLLLPVDGGEQEVQFDICEQVTGSWVGVYCAQEPKLIAALDKAVEKGQIVEIERSAYNRRLRAKKIERESRVNVESAADLSITQPPKPENDTVEVEAHDVTEDDMLGVEETGGKDPDPEGPASDAAETGEPDTDDSGAEPTEKEMTSSESREKPQDAYITKLPELAEALEISEDELAQLRAKEGCPARDGKGYNLRRFTEFLAAQQS